MNDPWIELGMMQAHRSPTGRRKTGYDSYSFTEFSLDATTFEHKGKRYMIWAEKVHRRFGISNLYIAEMEARAQQLGANAVVGVDIDYETFGNAGMIIVTASGTAVVVQNKE